MSAWPGNQPQQWPGVGQIQQQVWQRVKVASPGSAVVLNGGTLVDIAGGVSLTTPGGAATDPVGGVSLRIPYYYSNGQRARYYDQLAITLRFRELGIAPGLASDTYFHCGVIPEGVPFNNHFWGIGCHFSAATRAETICNTANVLPTAYTLNAVPVGTMRGGRNIAGLDLIPPGTSMYWSMACVAISADGSWHNYVERASRSWPARPATNANMDLWLALHRSAPTAGAETLEVAMEYLNPPPPVNP